jgi:hypothetical protein
LIAISAFKSDTCPENRPPSEVRKGKARNEEGIEKVSVSQAIGETSK